MHKKIRAELPILELLGTSRRRIGKEQQTSQKLPALISLVFAYSEAHQSLDGRFVWESRNLAKNSTKKPPNYLFPDRFPVEY